MEKLTEKQAEILECIKKFIASRGYPPTVREICKIKNIASPAFLNSDKSTDLSEVQFSNAFVPIAYTFDKSISFNDSQPLNAEVPIT